MDKETAHSSNMRKGLVSGLGTGPGPNSKLRSCKGRPNHSASHLSKLDRRRDGLTDVR